MTSPLNAAFMLQQGMNAFYHHIVIVSYKNFDVHYVFNSINTEVPFPGCELISSLPFKNSTLFIILVQPIPFAILRQAVSNPLPSSSTVIVSLLSVLLNCTIELVADACFIVLLINSW